MYDGKGTRLDRPKASAGSNLIGPNQHVPATRARRILQEARNRRRRVHPSVRQLVAMLPPGEEARIRACAKSGLRLTHDEERHDLIVPRLCRSAYCPWCPAAEHYKRATFQAARLASVGPTEGDLALRNLVFTTPPELRRWMLYDPRGIPALREAAWRTITGAFGLTNEKNRRDLAVVMNLHAIGTEAWTRAGPEWAPHLDVLLPATRRDGDRLRPLPKSWPELYARTRARYKDELLRAVQAAGAPVETTALVAARNDIVCRVGARVEGDRAYHRVWYSSRPLLEMGRARIEGDDLVYVPMGETKPRRCDPPAFIRTFLSLRDHLAAGDGEGGKTERGESAKTTTWHGFLGKSAYAKNCKKLGRTPTPWRPKKGWRIKDRCDENLLGEFSWASERHGGGPR